ncbi:MAG TPA: zinc ribbon domain-containing protein [Candidatus Binatia bacterium]|jgi:putative FmdB family regulatory protein
MPIYEYHCDKCGTFEATQKITDKPLARCPTCKGKVKKLISNTSFQLKGTGWYITDYARKDNKSPSDKAANGDKAATAETKSDGKAGAGSDGGKKDSTEKAAAKPAASESSSS